jgi:hypothetical protein
LCAGRARKRGNDAGCAERASIDDVDHWADDDHHYDDACGNDAGSDYASSNHAAGRDATGRQPV